MKRDFMSSGEAPPRPVLRYHGGKFRLAPWILSFFPEHLVYVEPFAGAASVLLQKPRVGAEVYNDLDGEVVNLFRVLRDPARASELQRRVALTPFARDEFDAAYSEPEDEVDRAHKLVIKAFLGFSSTAATRPAKSGFRANLTDGRVLPAIEYSSWHNAIPAFTQRLQGVLIENCPAVDIIARMDTPRTLIYADPPYCRSTRAKARGYRHEMTDDDHRELAAKLRAARGMVVLSGYPSDLYDHELYPDWIRHERPHVADHGTASTEVVWLNPACAATLERQTAQGRMFE
jgi:DNA adenine methylase